MYAVHTYGDIYDAARACEFVHMNLIGSHSISNKVCTCVQVSAAVFCCSQTVTSIPACGNKIIEIKVTFLPMGAETNKCRKQPTSDVYKIPILQQLLVRTFAERLSCL